MNNEQQQIIDEVYRHYLMEDVKILPNMSKEKMIELGYGLTQEEFINKCKTNTEFSERWGLKIEERELSHDERMQIWQKYQDGRGEFIMELLDNIPTKAITITYNDKTIESYE
jgi:hypothetical protein